MLFWLVIHLLHHFAVVEVLRCALSAGDQTLLSSLCWGNASYLLFMLFFLCPFQTLTSLRSHPFMWFCHHLSNVHGLENGRLFFSFLFFLLLFFFSLEVRQTYSKSQIRLLPTKRMSRISPSERQLKSVMVVGSVCRAMTWEVLRSGKIRALTAKVSQSVINGPGSEN